MKKIHLTIILSLAVIAVTMSSLKAQTGTTVGDNGTVYGLVFGDYFYKVSGDSSSGSTEYASYHKDYNTFEFRRIYLGYRHDISSSFTADFTLSYEGKDFTPAGNRTVYVKNAELQWKGIFTNADLVVGLTGTPAYGLVSEKVWGYRAIEKTILDMRGIVSSRDIGINLKGSFDKDKNYGYSFMIGNGRGTRLENNKYKRFYGELSGNFANKKIVTEVYSDYETVSSERSLNTLKGFASYKSDKFTAGVEAFRQTQKNFIGDTANVIPFGVSAFVTGNIVKDKLNFFGRFDYYDPDTENSTSGFKESFITAGLDFTPAKNVHFMPNVWVNTYTNKNTAGTEKDADIVPRVTFWYSY